MMINDYCMPYHFEEAAEDTPNEEELKTSKPDSRAHSRPDQHGTLIPHTNPGETHPDDLLNRDPITQNPDGSWSKPPTNPGVEDPSIKQKKPQQQSPEEDHETLVRLQSQVQALQRDLQGWSDRAVRMDRSTVAVGNLVHAARDLQEMGFWRRVWWWLGAGKVP